MEWIYLSPHLDDVALSCGGLVWEQAHSGDRPHIWSICAGDPPKGPFSPFAESLHQRWGTGRESTEKRRLEDASSCAALLASYRHFTFPDCIYRRSVENGYPLYASEEAIFGPLDSAELPLVEEICARLKPLIPESAVVISPLAVGGHVDHRLVRTAAEKLERPLWYYADYPYVERPGVEITQWLPGDFEKAVFRISEKGMQAWFDSVTAHASQISTFWTGKRSMEAALEEYSRKQGGIPLWEPVFCKD